MAFIDIYNEKIDNRFKMNNVELYLPFFLFGPIKERIQTKQTDESLDCLLNWIY